MNIFKSIPRRFVIIVAFLSVQLSSNCQVDWKEILKGSQNYYINQHNGEVEIEYKYKNVLKTDTNYFRWHLTYHKGNERIARRSIESRSAYMIFLNNKAYFINPQLGTYDSSIKNNDHFLEMFPQWNTTKYFADYFMRGRIYGVKTVEMDSLYVLLFKGRGGFETLLYINKNKFQLIKSVETVVHSKHGTQFKEFIFSERAEPDEREVIKEELNFVTKTYAVRNEKEIENQQSAVKSKLLHSKVDRGTLSGLLFGDQVSQYNKHYLVLDFFYQSCLPCIKAIPELNQLYALTDSSIIKIIGVDPILNDANQFDKFISKYKIKYSILDGELAIRVKDLIFGNVHILYPTVLLIAPDGTVEWVIDGFKRNEFKLLNEHVDKILDSQL